MERCSAHGRLFSLTDRGDCYIDICDDVTTIKHVTVVIYAGIKCAALESSDGGCVMEVYKGFIVNKMFMTA